MIKRTKEEIEAEAAKIWSKDRFYPDSDVLKINQPRFVATLCDDGTVELVVTNMYEPPGLTLANLMALAEFMGTQNIHDDSISHEGCETCDYGSVYGFALTIRD